MAQGGTQYHQIKFSGWRYAIAQRILSLLYGKRSQYYFYPWPQAGISSNALLTHNKKVMLQLRQGTSEADGCWCNFGGYSDPTTETPCEALYRELEEECGLKLSKKLFRDDNVMAVINTFNKPMAALESECHISVFWHYELTRANIKKMKPLDETAGFELFSWKEVEALWKAHKIHHTQTPDVYRSCQIAKEKGLID